MDVTVWEMIMVCSSRGQVAPTAPVQRVSRVPDGVGAEEGELAAGLSDLADLGHLRPVAELGEDRLVPWVDHTPCSDFQRDVTAFKAISLDLSNQVFVPGGLPLESRRHVVGGVPGDGQLH